VCVCVPGDAAASHDDDFYGQERGGLWQIVPSHAIHARTIKR